MKKLLAFLALVFILSMIPASSKDYPQGWSCKCTVCGKTTSGEIPNLVCDYDHGACICTKKAPIRF